MTHAIKYAFDTEFAPDGEILRDAARRVTAEEVEAARQEGYERGRNDATAQAERQTAAALEAIANAASAVLTRLEAESHALRAEAANLALVSAKKIAGAALDAFGTERAAHAVEAAMDALRHQPRLVVKLPPAQAEQLKPRISEMCQTHAYASAVLVREEPSLRTGEVVLDWSDGVVSLSPETAIKHIESLIERALAAHASPEPVQ
jgi:flagellar assembly protein FliH